MKCIGECSDFNFYFLCIWFVTQFEIGIGIRSNLDGNWNNHIRYGKSELKLRCNLNTRKWWYRGLCALKIRAFSAFIKIKIIMDLSLIKWLEWKSHIYISITKSVTPNQIIPILFLVTNQTHPQLPQSFEENNPFPYVFEYTGNSLHVSYPSMDSLHQHGSSWKPGNVS